MLTEFLQEMFEGELPTVVSDSPASARWASSIGLPFRGVSEIGDAPAAAFVILTLDENYSKQDMLQRAFARSRVLWFPLAAFDGTDDAVSYAVRHLENMNFASMIRGHQAALELVEQSDHVVFEGDRGTDVEIAFGTEVEFTMLSDLRIPAGGQSPLASFFEFETEIENFADDRPLPFVVNGILRPSGVLCAHGPGSYTAEDATVREARSLARRAATEPTVVAISDGVVSSIKMGADDVTSEFSALAGPHGSHISEFAIGFYRAPDGSLDWQMNSPVNEGAQGIHFGIGDGYSGLHFDFVCEDVTSN